MSTPPLNSPFAPTSVIPGAAAAARREPELAQAEQLVLCLCDSERRPGALEALVVLYKQKKVTGQDLAPLLWYSFGTMAALIQEMVSLYRSLEPPTLSLEASRKVVNVLVLIQCIATHPETIVPFLDAHIPSYIIPFLNTTSRETPYEILRTHGLGVIGALSKVGDSEVISYLLRIEIVPLCLCSMENGKEVSRRVATFILQNILRDNAGLHYTCSTAERFGSVCHVLRAVVATLAEEPSVKLLDYTIRCYWRLSEHQKSSLLLARYLPLSIIDGTFSNLIRDEPQTLEVLELLIRNIIASIRNVTRMDRAAAIEGGFDQLLSYLETLFPFI